MYISNVNSASIKLNQIQSNHIQESETPTLASSDYLTLVYIHKGAAHYETKQGELVELKKREVLILNPGHSITLTPIRKMEIIIVQLSGIVFTSSIKLDTSDTFFHIKHTPSTFKDYLDLALAEAEKQSRGTDLLLKKLVECLLIQILRNHELSIKDSSMQSKSHEIEKIQTYIRDNYSEKITLDSLSEVADINKYYLIRLFKQFTGLSPIDYLIHVRLKEAERLLVTTNMSVATISDFVGFHSPSHFSKTFKEYNHITPTKYRHTNSNTQM
ncbi:AraC family transcriptional regulator [Tuanshanicoccus lijuaniae]|uniref:AraC family transcriptional regulator n=1 Tax=Aerococcaceae bacterium zg-1292 TaxID=2774330 RepID=UPI001BD87D13|nr:helix-turn-helix transcriptional regulator [Aerococcaceae bacterium zg-BR9]MBF6978337.1 helix-turn-helix transcriptional regulator [Aerococcaceae bacterium zg-BR22]MBS4456576.1 helix-turn-helix transcriptional regulator [Aerococcaceae bacterium zg-A91]MBS4458368.1 helix-turn-helix transcriptional regulator [Aerococcaceae bacterium zg-BR33]